MSLSAVVKLELYNEKITIDEKVDLSFKLVEISTKNRIGIKIEGNVWNGFISRVNNSNKNEIIFELMDDPITNVIEDLFMGKSFPDYNERMNNIKNFLQSIYNLKGVKKITLDIDACPTEEEMIEHGVPVINLHPKEFKEIMFKLHEENSHDTPMVRLIMDKRLNDKLFIVNELG